MEKEKEKEKESEREGEGEREREREKAKSSTSAEGGVVIEGVRASQKVLLLTELKLIVENLL